MINKNRQNLKNWNIGIGRKYEHDEEFDYKKRNLKLKGIMRHGYKQTCDFLWLCPIFWILSKADIHTLPIKIDFNPEKIREKFWHKDYFRTIDKKKTMC